jgi:hypothetical protein
MRPKIDEDPRNFNMEEITALSKTRNSKPLIPFAAARDVR